MFGRTIEARSPISTGAVIFMAIAVGLVAWSVAAQTPHLAIAAVLPVCLALALWLGRPSSAIVTMEPDAIVQLGSAERIRYESITSLGMGGSEYYGAETGSSNKPLEIGHSKGVLILPGRMNVDVVEIALFLRERMASAEERPIPAALAEFAREQQAKFGADRVEIIRTRQICPERWTGRRNLAVVLAVLATGLLWFTIALLAGPFVRSAEEYAVWLVFGVIAAIGSFFVWLVMRSARSTPLKQLTGHQAACIVIGPAGLAMSQDDMEGVLRWDQIKDATTNFSQFLRSRRISGLKLVIQGGEIIALDIYERSPHEIERLVRSRLET
jgi:hypothetical protein